MVTSESSNFLCFRLQRLRTSSDTGRRAIQVRIHEIYSLYWILNNQSEEKWFPYLPDMPRSVCSPQTYHSSGAFLPRPTACAGYGWSVPRWWGRGAGTLQKQNRNVIVFQPKHKMFEYFCIKPIYLPFNRCPTKAKLKLELKLRPTKWSICLQCHSKGWRISINTSSGLWEIDRTNPFCFQ